MLQGSTTVFCRDCGEHHAARIERHGDAIVGVVDCRENPRTVELSDDADLFLHLRGVGDAGAEASPRESGDHATRGQIYITESCDWKCPVCYASAGPRGGGAHLSVDEVERRAAAARARGLRRVVLLGGEPTLHPELIAIVTRIRRLGLAVSLTTNGERVARDPELARQLRRAGLTHLNLQFDTFERGTMLRLRGRADLELKQTAITHTIAAGIAYSLMVTVTTLNVGEVGALVRWAGTLPVMPSLVLFQSMARSGRFPAELQGVSRERVIRSLFDSAVIDGLAREHLHGLPRLRPEALAIHPDCGTLLFLLRRGGALMPADYDFDMAGFNRAMVGDGGLRRNWFGWFVAFVRHLQPGFRWEMVNALLDLRPGRPNRRLLVVGFTSFCDPDFLDVQRLSRCWNHVLLAATSEPVCFHFGRQKCSTPAVVRTSP